MWKGNVYICRLEGVEIRWDLFFLSDFGEKKKYLKFLVVKININIVIVVVVKYL